MSLKDFKESVVEVAEDMLAEAEDLKGKLGDAAAFMHATLKGYAKRLKTACRAAGDDDMPTPFPQTAFNPLAAFMTPAAQHAIEVDKYRKEFRKTKEAGDVEEQFHGDMVQIIGGPACPDDTPTVQSVDPGMPADGTARMCLAGGVYVLIADNGVRKLIYDGVETARINGELAKKKIITSASEVDKSSLSWEEAAKVARRGGVL